MVDRACRFELVVRNKVMYEEVAGQGDVCQPYSLKSLLVMISHCSACLALFITQTTGLNAISIFIAAAA
jgi:hypothetical protein